MLKDKSTSDYKSWDKKRYVDLAKKNPAHFLLQSGAGFFKEKEGYVIALDESLVPFKDLLSFKEHFKDIIEYRTLTYYKSRYDKGEEKFSL